MDKHPDSAVAAFTAVAASLPFPPADPAAYFTIWLRRSRRVAKIPHPVLLRVVKQLGGYIIIRSFGGVAGIVSDDLIRAFVPEAVLFPARGGVDDIGPLDEWLRRGGLPEPMVVPDEMGAAR